MRFARNAEARSNLLRLISIIVLVITVGAGIGIAAVVLDWVEVGQLATKYHNLVDIKDEFEEFAVVLVTNLTVLDTEITV
jgi:hypothetical protein